MACARRGAHRSARRRHRRQRPGTVERGQRRRACPPGPGADGRHLRPLVRGRRAHHHRPPDPRPAGAAGPDREMVGARWAPTGGDDGRPRAGDPASSLHAARCTSTSRARRRGVRRSRGPRHAPASSPRRRGRHMTWTRSGPRPRHRASRPVHPRSGLEAVHALVDGATSTRSRGAFGAPSSPPTRRRACSPTSHGLWAGIVTGGRDRARAARPPGRDAGGRARPGGAAHAAMALRRPAVLAFASACTAGRGYGGPAAACARRLPRRADRVNRSAGPP